MIPWTGDLAKAHQAFSILHRPARFVFPDRCKRNESRREEQIRLSSGKHVSQTAVVTSAQVHAVRGHCSQEFPPRTCRFRLYCDISRGGESSPAYREKTIQAKLARHEQQTFKHSTTCWHANIKWVHMYVSGKSYYATLLKYGGRSQMKASKLTNLRSV